MKRLEIFENVSFGLELETCVHILDNNLFKQKVSENNMKKSLLVYTDCLQKKIMGSRYGKYLSVEYYEITDDVEDRPIRYDKWYVVKDDTIKCNYKKLSKTHRPPKENYCILRAQKKTGEDCPKLVFYPVELVMPILYGGIGLKYITIFWNGMIFGKNLVYSVNSTQGLHTNISHSKLDINKFLDIWVYFEPIIWQIIGQTRRKQIIKGGYSQGHAIPLSALISLERKIKGNKKRLLNPAFAQARRESRDEIKLSSKQQSQEEQKTSEEQMSTRDRLNYRVFSRVDKYSSVSVKSETNPRSRRIEIRLYPGTMDFFDAYYWTMFCMWFMAFTINVDKNTIPKPPKNPTSFTVKDRQALLQLFFDIVGDTHLVAFLQKKYNHNKQKTPDYWGHVWPVSNYNMKKTRPYLKSYYPKKILENNNVKKAIKKYQKISCE